MSEMNQWEYRVQTFGTLFGGAKDEPLEAELAQWGLEGWEVVGFRSIEGSSRAQVIARRPMTAEARRRATWPGQ